MGLEKSRFGGPLPVLKRKKIIDNLGATYLGIFYVR
jgi:hypothetical protein